MYTRFCKTYRFIEQVTQLIKELDEKHEEDNEYLTNRVNNLITQNNPTEGNSELIDIRLGADGKTYPTAGEAVRKQLINTAWAYLFGDGYINIDTTNRTYEIKSNSPGSEKYMYISGAPNGIMNYYRLWANKGAVKYQPDDYYPAFVMAIYVDTTGYKQDTENPENQVLAELKIDLITKFKSIYTGKQFLIGILYRNSISGINSPYFRIDSNYLVDYKLLQNRLQSLVKFELKFAHIANSGINAFKYSYTGSENLRNYTITMQNSGKVYGFIEDRNVGISIVNSNTYPDETDANAFLIPGSITYEEDKSTSSWVFMTLDSTDNLVKIKRLAKLTSNDYIVCAFYETNFEGFENTWVFEKPVNNYISIPNSDKNILYTVRKLGLNIFSRPAVPYSGKITLGTSGFSLIVSKLALFYGYNGSWLANEPSMDLEIDWSQETNPSYAKFLMLNSTTKKVALMSTTEIGEVFNGNSIINMYSWYLIAIIYNKHIMYTTSVQKGIYYEGSKDIYDNSTTETEYDYDYENFRFIMPENLYLIKDLPCAALTQNMCLPQFSEEDSLKFEIALPSFISQGEETLNINVPFEHTNPFKTRIAVKHKDYSYMYSKDINLYVADVSKLTKKDCKVLNIGDSITESMLPSCLNWFMKSLGLNSTFIGTKSNSNKGYGYGILDDLTICKGEGRGGWRLTDFACRTKKIDNTRYVESNFEMMNPETQEFDFSYYMQSQSFDGVDFVTIQLGTNDISGYHYAGSVSTNPMYQQIYRPSLEDYLNPDNEFYIINLYKLLIDSILAYNPSIKIAISAPMVNTFQSTNTSYLRWAEVIYDYFENNESYPNVYCISCGMWQGNMSVHAINSGVSKDPVAAKNTTYKVTNNNVHVNGMGELMQALPMAAWIANMLKSE